MSELTDLEGAALAEIHRSGPTTSYAVAKAFANSPSEFWSGSAGAVYPLIERLRSRRLLRATRGKDGARVRTDYSLTASGRAALRAWLLDARRAAGIGFDPLRTRVIHLDQVSARQRAAFLAQVRAHLQQAAAQVRQVVRHLPRLPD
ncbi:MAG TPA: PadR family transcriptional regulator, partial [Kofleriaceae bacterium]|nr:PadR family transcriptional regulator [Kofleriaceae bacterium]